MSVETLDRLLRRLHDFIPRWDLLEGYYEGERRLQAMGLALPPEMEDLQVVINWPGMYVDSIDERLDVEGFRLGDSDEGDETLWGYWQANDLDEQAPQLHTESMWSSRAYTCLGFPADRDDAPVITVESSRSMIAEVDPATLRTRAAARLWDDDDNGIPQRATLYLPDSTIYYGRSTQGRGWIVDRIDRHDLGEALVVPAINRPRISRGRGTGREGVSQMRSIMDLADAACRSMTNLQGAQELLAVPQRFVAGASEQDFIDSKTGQPIPAWQAYLGRLWALMDHEAKVFQLSGADLRNFTETLTHYARIAAGLTGLPEYYWGFAADNPASAEAIVAGETRLIKMSERKHTVLGGTWERTMRLAARIDGRRIRRAERLETIWRDPSTPTYAAKADAAVKLVAAGILPVEAAWEDMGYSVERRRRLRSLMSQDPADRYLANLERLQAREAG